MKNTRKTAIIALTALCGSLVGCDSSKTEPAPEQTPTPQPPAASAPTSSEKAPAPPREASTPAATSQVKQLAEDTSQAAKDAFSDLTSKLTKSADGPSDPKLRELAQDLTEKVKSFSSTLTENAPLKEKLQDAVASLSSGQDGESLSFFQRIKEANLTPEQSQLAGEVKNVWSAVVVQKNFSNLSTSEGEVGKIVNALQGGDTTTALTNLKELASKATLSPPQKDLLNTVVAQYAPGLQDAGAAAQEGLKKLNPFDK